MPVFRGSRYTNTPAYIKNGESLVLTIRNRQRFRLDSATLYTVVVSDTIDGIAYKMYRDSNLYWAILDANPQYQTVLDIKPGDIIVIPALEEVVNTLE